ncbi:disulfide bond formation protein B [Marinimicrobium sp. ARAG 43.8]|uniref:disulfide bond formation protein B n=1 Tax=Marinimicrobium sp. ARAG 43.8 TaxID=3418719 RepID=UPI003CECEE2A
MLPSVRLTNCLIVMLVVFMMGVALYMEHGMGLEPCPLCISQRIFVILAGVWALLAFLHHPGRIGRRVYGLLGLLSAAAGAAVSARQLWLQSLPEDQVPACGPGLDYMLDAFPLLDVLRAMLAGDGNCAEVSWSLFGISIPGWTLIGFLVLGLAHLWQVLRRRQ